jgi:DNA-binding MarR family transcriptional regulator
MSPRRVRMTVGTRLNGISICTEVHLKSMTTNAVRKNLIKVWHDNDTDVPPVVESHDALRLWLRIMMLYKLVYREVHNRLRDTFAITLARFDFMAQLDRHPAGIRMGDISNRLMVTSGNVTQLTDQLEKEGLVERAPDPHSRRACLVRLTSKGRKAFNAIAVEHEKWIIDIFSGLSRQERKVLLSLLSKEKSLLTEARR